MPVHLYVQTKVKYLIDRDNDSEETKDLYCKKKYVITGFTHILEHLEQVKNICV